MHSGTLYILKYCYIQIFFLRFQAHESLTNTRKFGGVTANTTTEKKCKKVKTVKETHSSGAVVFE